MKYAILAALVLVGFVLYTNINKTEEKANVAPQEVVTAEPVEQVPAEENPLITAFFADTDLDAPFITTESGLKYAVLKDGGEGETPIRTAKVEVHYHGTTADGEVFDSSVLRGETIEFPLSSLITGWQEGIPLMNVGDKYRLIVPAVLAYGESGGHPLAGKDLTFDIELFAFEN